MTTSRRRSLLPRAKSKHKAGAVRTVRPHPLAWARAKELAGGDIRRLRVLPDGSIVVTNPPAST